MSLQLSNTCEDRLACKVCYDIAFNEISYEIVLCAKCHYLYCLNCFNMLNNICSQCKSAGHYILDTRKSELQYLLNLDPSANEFITAIRTMLVDDKSKFNYILQNFKNKFFAESQSCRNTDLRALMQYTVNSLRDIKNKLDEEITIYQKNKRDLEQERTLVEASQSGLEERETKVKEGEKRLYHFYLRENALREREEVFKALQDSLEIHEKNLKNREENLKNREENLEFIQQKIELANVESRERDLDIKAANYNRRVEEYYKACVDLEKRISAQTEAENSIAIYNKRLETKEANLIHREQYLYENYLNDRYQEIDIIKKKLVEDKKELDKYKSKLDESEVQLNIQKLELNKKEADNQAQKLQLEHDRNYFNTYYFVFRQQELDEKTKKIDMQIKEINNTQKQLHQEIIELARTKLLVYDMYCKMRTKKIKEDTLLNDSQKKILEETGKIVEKATPPNKTHSGKYDPISYV